MNKTSKDIKKKLSLNDYSMPVTQQSNKETSQQVAEPVIGKVVLNKDNRQVGKSPECLTGKSTCQHDNTPAKIKATYYLNSEANKQFTEVYINRLKNDQKTDRSALICEAIKLLFKNEF
jgi:hypothetical protein